MVLKNFQKLQHGRTNELQAVGRGNHKFKNSLFFKDHAINNLLRKTHSKMNCMVNLGNKAKI